MPLPLTLTAFPSILYFPLHTPLPAPRLPPAIMVLLCLYLISINTSSTYCLHLKFTLLLNPFWNNSATNLRCQSAWLGHTYQVREKKRCGGERERGKERGVWQCLVRGGGHEWWLWYIIYLKDYQQESPRCERTVMRRERLGRAGWKGEKQL